MNKEKYLTVSVSTVWNGQVAIRDRYLKEAKRDGLGLRVYAGGGVMFVPHEELDTRVRGKSKTPVKDKFSKTSHYLVYFTWLPWSEKKEDVAKVVKEQQLTLF